MAHFSLLDLSHAAFDDTSKAYRAVTTTLDTPCSTIRPCSSTTHLWIIRVSDAITVRP